MESNGGAGRRGAKSLVVYMFGGGRCDLSSNGIKYEGGKRAVVVLKEGISYDEVIRTIMGKFPTITGDVVVWFTIPLSPETYMPLDCEDAVNAMFVGDHAHVYVCSSVEGGGATIMEVDREQAVLSTLTNEPNIIDKMPNMTAEGPVEDAPMGFDLQQDEIAGVSNPNSPGDPHVSDGHNSPPPEHSDGNDDAENENYFNNSWGDERLQTGGLSDCDSAGDLPECAKAKKYSQRMRVWKKEITGVGQSFPTSGHFRVAVFKYALAHNFSYKFYRNSKDRLGVHCRAEGCQFDLYACGRVGVRVKRFVAEHNHSVVAGSRSSFRMRSSLLAEVIEGKDRGLHDYPPNELIKDIELELGIKLTYKQAWRSREFVTAMINGKARDQYKLLPWLCASIIRANPDSFGEVETIGDRFSRFFLSIDACLNGFKISQRHILFVDACHLSGPYKGTMLSACGVDADNNFINVCLAVVSSENCDNWLWFLLKLQVILAGVKPVIMSDRHPGLVSAVNEVFGHEWHTYCLRHLCENFVKEVHKQGLRNNSKDIAVEMMMRIAYATNHVDYAAALEELRQFKGSLANWVEANEPERWALSLFPKNKFGWMNNNVAKSFNKWMRPVRVLPIGLLLATTIDMLSEKSQCHKSEAHKWVNCVGPRIELALKRRVSLTSNVCKIQRFGVQEYQVTSTNSTRLVVNLSDHTCTCREWQLTQLPCLHALKVISDLDLNLYEFVGACYKKPSQLVIYNQNIHPMESHDMPTIGEDGVVVGGDELDHGFHRSIRPPKSRGRPHIQREESEFPDKKSVRCSRCYDVGHNRRSCKNNEDDVEEDDDVEDDHPADPVTFSDLFGTPC